MAITVVPAYGRDYKSKVEVLAAWHAGKDFLIHDMFSPYDGSYINKEDADRAGGTVNIRYLQLRKVVVVRPGSSPGEARGRR